MTSDQIKAILSGTSRAEVETGFSQLCDGRGAIDLVYHTAWLIYTRVQRVPIITEKITLVVGAWSVPDFPGLVRGDGSLTIFGGALPRGVKIPSGAEVYTIGLPADVKKSV